MKEKIRNATITLAERMAGVVWAVAIILIVLVMLPFIILSLLLEDSINRDRH